MSPQRQIPQCSPHGAYAAQAAAIDAAIQRVLTGGRYILGPEVTEFEREFAGFVGAAHALGVANGTDALFLALKALGIGPGDAVISTSLSAVATTVAIRSTGAIPLFADADPSHGLIDPEQIDALIAVAAAGRAAVSLQRIKAIVPVHLYGRCADMPAIMAIARRHGMAVVEDCAQAHGASFDGRSAGTFGDFGTFSFYPTKNLGAIGDGGAVVTSDARLREQVRLLREYGWRERYISDVEGGNSRLDELQAALLRVKLATLASDNDARRAIAALYRDGLRHSGVQLDRGADDGHVYHQFVVRTGGRAQLQQHLRVNGIGTLVHYPAAIHEQPAYRDPDYRPLALSETERWASEVLSLPMFPQLPHDDVRFVIDTINAWDGGR